MKESDGRTKTKRIKIKKKIPWCLMMSSWSLEVHYGIITSLVYMWQLFVRLSVTWAKAAPIIIYRRIACAFRTRHSHTSQSCPITTTTILPVAARQNESRAFTSNGWCVRRIPASNTLFHFNLYTNNGASCATCPVKHIFQWFVRIQWKPKAHCMPKSLTCSARYV